MADELEVRARAAPRMLTLSCLVEGRLPPDLSSSSRDQPSQSPAPCAGTPRAASSRCSSFARRSSSSRVRASSSCSAEGSRRAALRCSSHSICGREGCVCCQSAVRLGGRGKPGAPFQGAFPRRASAPSPRAPPSAAHPPSASQAPAPPLSTSPSLPPTPPARRSTQRAQTRAVAHDAELERVLRLHADRRRRRRRLVGLCRRACGPGRARGRGAAAPVVGTGVRRELLEDGVHADVRVEGAHPVRVLLPLVVGGRSEVARRRKRRCVPQRGDGSRWRGCLTARRSPRRATRGCRADVHVAGRRGSTSDGTRPSERSCAVEDACQRSGR